MGYRGGQGPEGRGVNAEDRRRLDELVRDLVGAVEDAHPSATVTLAVRMDRTGHICCTSEVIAPRRPLLRVVNSEP